MRLTFPTLAEQCLAQFKSPSTGTVSISTIAKKMGAEVKFQYPTTEYIFDDDTSITVQGRGVGHKVECHLP